jgi:hypothetical protein
MKPRFTMRQALGDPALLGASLAGSSWHNWRVLLTAMMGERLKPSERKVFTTFTGRGREPTQRVDEAAFVIGRRGGKDRAASILTTYLAGLCDHRDVLVPGERGVIVCIAPDQRQARITLGYVEAAFQAAPILARLIKSRNSDALELTNGIAIEVRAASFRRIRGVTALAVIASEAAFWMDAETSSNPDTEILAAARPALATTGGPLILISSPYARRGELWSIFKKHYGANGDPRILVAKGTSRDFNPTLPQSVIDRAYERDPAAAAAEYGAEFRTDVELFLSREAVEGCMQAGVRELAPVGTNRYRAFVDPSGGSSDSFTIAIAHREKQRIVIDAIRERRPPFSPEAVVSEFAQLLKQYSVGKVYGDRYAGEWPREAFRKYGVTYTTCETVKSDLYRDMLPLINSNRIDLLGHPRLISQLCNLERHTGRSGKDVISHPPGAGQHDDVANAIAGAIWAISAHGGPITVTPEMMAWARQPHHPAQVGMRALRRRNVRTFVGVGNQT